MNIFNERMTSSEAQSLFFSIAGNKPRSDIEAIKKEYSEIIPKIVKRELKENANCLTSYSIANQ